jgi:hypothetical protein
MSQSEPETVPSAPAETRATTPPRDRPGFFRRVADWYTCRPQRERARAAASASPRARELLARAKTAFATANLLTEPADPSRRDLAPAHAAGLYAEALAWALWSYQPNDDPPRPEDRWDAAAAARKELAFSDEQLAEVDRLLAEPRVAMTLADRPRSERENAARMLKRAALVVIDVRERPLRAEDGIALVAFARMALTVLVLAGGLGMAIALRPEKPNLVAGKPWTTSSSLLECHPAKIECGGVRTRIFFHTRDEDNPWLRYDLGTPTAFSSMRIENRQDAEGARAVPLVVEIGDDGSHFREIARRDKDFSTWKPSFPTVTARYIRLRVARKSILHLEEVDVYR